MDLVSPFQVPSLIPLKYLVPSILTERETGLDTWSRLLSPTGDGISTLVPSFQTERGTGLDTWSRLFWLTGDGISTLVPSFVTQRGTGLDTWSRFFYLVHGPVSALLHYVIVDYSVSQKKWYFVKKWPKSVTQKTHYSSKSPLQLFLKIASNFKSKLVPYEDKKNCDQQFRLFDEKCVFWVTDFG